MNRNLPRLAYRPREAAEVTGLSLRFLFYAIQQKYLPTVRAGHCRTIAEMLGVSALSERLNQPLRPETKL
jgi:hypothetical protein